MGYVLFWVESLAVALLLVAWVAACAARWSNRWGQRVVPLLVAFILIALAAGITSILGFGYFQRVLGYLPFLSMLGWTLALTTGMVILWFRGLKRTGADSVPLARDWPRGRLALGLAAMLMVDFITFTNMDLAIKVQLATVRVEAGAPRAGTGASARSRRAERGAGLQAGLQSLDADHEVNSRTTGDMVRSRTDEAINQARGEGRTENRSAEQGVAEVSCQPTASVDAAA